MQQQRFEPKLQAGKEAFHANAPPPKGSLQNDAKFGPPVRLNNFIEPTPTCYATALSTENDEVKA